MPFGNDFSSLQAADTAADTNRRISLASAVNTANSGLQFMTEQSRRQQVMEFEEGQAKLAQQNKESEMALAKTKADWELKHWNDQNAIAQQYVDMQKPLVKAQVDAGTAAGVRAHQQELQTAQQDAATGFQALPSGMDPEQYPQVFYPTLKPGERQAVLGTATAAWQQQQDAYDKAQKAADTLNNYDILNTKVAAAKKKLDTFGIIGRNVTDRSAYQAAQQDYDHLTAAQATMQPFVQGLQQAIKSPKHPLSQAISPPTGPGDIWSLNVNPPKRNPYAMTASDADYLYGPTGNDQQPDSADTAGEMTPVPTRGIAPAMTSTATTQPGAVAAGQQPKFHPLVYQRAYQLMGQGTDPATAMRTALSDFQQAQAQGSIP